MLFLEPGVPKEKTTKPAPEPAKKGINNSSIEFLAIYQYTTIVFLLLYFLLSDNLKYL